MLAAKTQIQWSKVDITAKATSVLKYTRRNADMKNITAIKFKLLDIGKTNMYWSQLKQVVKSILNSGKEISVIE